MSNFPIHTGLAMATVGLFLAGAKLLVPAVHGPATAQFTAIVDFAPDRVPLSPLSRRSDPEPPVVVSHSKTPMIATLLDDSDGRLDHFYEALWRTEKGEKGAVTHIEHYGDSPTTADLITGDIRSQLQKRFGDAGHGFVLVAKPWAWYQHTGVQLTASGWQMIPATRFETRDGLYGLGGVTFTGSGSAHTKVEFQNDAYTRFEAWFLRQPGGGAFTLLADGKPLGRVETAGDAKAPGFAHFQADAASELEIRVDEGSVRIFGLTAEGAGPGVVYDSLGLNGASITVLSRMFNEAHWSEELRHRNPDLVIINYGTNEADFASFVDHQYEKELRDAIARVRGALPDASVLVMSPMDRGYRSGPGEIETMPTIPRIVEIQKRVARETGCGFFDTYDAMGGEGTMARWYTGQPRLVSADFIHPYPAGGKIIASAFTREIGGGLNRYKLRQVQQNGVTGAVR